MNDIHRPYKYGPHNRQEYIVSNSEQQLRAVNDTDGSPVFIGLARFSSRQTDPVWQIKKITYDANGGVIKIQWPLDITENSIPSTSYKFNYETIYNFSITGITQGTTTTIAAANTLLEGEKVVLSDVMGMTELNFNGSNLYTAKNVTSSGFDLWNNNSADNSSTAAIDSTGFSQYESGGNVEVNKALQYVYS